AHVAHREAEDRHERARLPRLRALVGDALARGPVLNLGCGTGGFNVAAEEAGARVVGVDADPDAIAICELKRRVRGGRYGRAAAFRRAGVTALELAAGDPPRESVGPLRTLAAAYYRLTRVTPFIELVARKA